MDRARGSLFELDSWLNTAAKRNYLTESEYEALGEQISEINAMLYALRESLCRQART